MSFPACTFISTVTFFLFFFSTSFVCMFHVFLSGCGAFLLQRHTQAWHTSYSVFFVQWFGKGQHWNFKKEIEIYRFHLRLYQALESRRCFGDMTYAVFAYVKHCIWWEFSQKLINKIIHEIKHAMQCTVLGTGLFSGEWIKQNVSTAFFSQFSSF